MKQTKFIVLVFTLIIFALSVQISSAQSSAVSKGKKESKATNSLNGKNNAMISRAQLLKDFRIHLNQEFLDMAVKAGFDIAPRSIKKGDWVYIEITEEDIIDLDLKSVEISFSIAKRLVKVTFVSYSHPDESIEITIPSITEETPVNGLIG